MMTSARVCLATLVVFAVGCSSSDSSSNSGKGGTGGGAGTGTGASGGSGGSGGIVGGGGSGASSGSGGSGAINGSTFCVLGMKGCACDGGVCASGLVCTNNTCCDQKTGDCSPPPQHTGTGGAAGSGAGGSAGASDGGVCVPGVVGPVITDCGYPYASSNPLTSVTFNEGETLRVIDPSGGAPLASVRLFYNDEHALTLGVRHVDVTTASGTTGKDYPVTPLTTDPSATAYPQTGTNEVSGDYSGLDQSGRPMWPVLYVTDITNDANDRSGDWQQGGTPYNPNAVFGSWKSAVRTVDNTLTPADVSITPDKDPAKNNWNLGGGDPVPSGLVNQGYGAEVRWNLVLIPGRSYRIQVLVHDGDQNKAGGDSGEACVNFCAGNSCPTGSTACKTDGECPGGYCSNGCCLATIK